MTGGRPWSEEDIAKLKSLAGRRPAKDIAVALGRSFEATVVAASKLKLSLRTRFHFSRAISAAERGTKIDVELPGHYRLRRRLGR